MTYYGDLECPTCRDFTLLGGFPQLLQHQVRAGTVKVIYNAFCTATCNNHPQRVFTEQQAAALAAGQQHKFWYYAELFYREQGDETTDYVNTAYLQSIARQVPGLDYTTWNHARSTPGLSNQPAQQETHATSVGVGATPTLIFTGPTGKTSQPSSPVPSFSDLQASIKQVS